MILHFNGGCMTCWFHYEELWNKEFNGKQANRMIRRFIRESMHNPIIRKLYLLAFGYEHYCSDDAKCISGHELSDHFKYLDNMINEECSIITKADKKYFEALALAEELKIPNGIWTILSCVKDKNGKPKAFLGIENSNNSAFYLYRIYKSEDNKYYYVVKSRQLNEDIYDGNLYDTLEQAKEGVKKSYEALKNDKI